MYSLGTVPTLWREGRRERGRDREWGRGGGGGKHGGCKGGNKGRVGRDASILQHGRYVGIASRGSLSRTANYGIMHTAGSVPQLWLCYEFVLTQGSPCRRNGSVRRPRHVGHLSRDIYGEKGVKAHWALKYLPSLFSCSIRTSQCHMQVPKVSASETETSFCRTVVFLRFFLFSVSAYRLHKMIEMQSL